MKQPIPTLMWLAAVASVMASSAAVAANRDDNRDSAWLKRTVSACAACHGERGVSNVAAFPTIAGQPASYLVEALRDYRDGDRQNAVMAGQARGLTDRQINALAAYYHDQPSPLAVPQPVTDEPSEAEQHQD